jgi:hypothetical protein
MAKARTRFWRWNERRMFAAYRDAYERLASRTRIRQISKLSLERKPEGASPFVLADLSDDRLFGFHRQEQSNGTRFRWSRSVAFAEVSIDPGSYSVEIDTCGLRDPTHLGVQVFFNDARIPADEVQLDPRLIRFSVGPELFRAGSDQRVGLACRPFIPSRVTDSSDKRELGLPVSSLSFEPAGEADR